MSPWAYLGHEIFRQLAEKYDLNVILKPIPLGEVFAQTGGLPLFQRHEARRRYRDWEMQRWILKRGFPMNFQPKYWPFDAKLADKVVIAAVELGEWKAAERFAFYTMKGSWSDELNCADEAVLRKFLSDALNGDSNQVDKIFQLAKTDGIAAKYAENVAEAVKAGAIGAPVYVRDGECFWGQDRLELLEDAIKSGRKGFPAPRL